MADFPSPGISLDISKTNTLKTHTEPHTVPGSRTLKDVQKGMCFTVILSTEITKAAPIIYLVSQGILQPDFHGKHA